MQVRKMKLLRLKYNISRTELGVICGMSPQRISEIELNAEPVLEESTVKRLHNAFVAIIDRRSGLCESLRMDYQKNMDTLMDGVEEIGYEL